MSVPKTIIVFMDGTWQHDAQETLTNIPKLRNLRRKRHKGRSQWVRYAKGVGASDNIFKKAFGGAFGIGLADKIIRVYRFLADSYQPGDQIVLVGYSRGAYSVRSLAGMINKVGLIDWEKYAQHKAKNPK